MLHFLNLIGIGYLNKDTIADRSMQIKQIIFLKKDK